MRDSVPSGSYSSVCNVLRQWKSRSSLLIESTDSMINKIIENPRMNRPESSLRSQLYSTGISLGANNLDKP